MSDEFPSLSRLKSLSLRLESGLLQHSNRASAPQPNRKKPRLGFFSYPAISRSPNRRQPLRPRWEIRPTPTKSTSGIPRWQSRDSIWEQGEFNLYAFMGNNGVDRWDVFGRSPISRTRNRLKMAFRGIRSTSCFRAELAPFQSPSDN